MPSEKLKAECDRVVRDIERRVESFMHVDDGEGPGWLHDGVMSVLLGCIDGKSVQIEIHVQPH